MTSQIRRIKKYHDIFRVSISTAVLSLSIQKSDKICQTTSDSKVPNAECVFPFTYENITYTGCPMDQVGKTKRWCPTETDENGLYLHDQKNYGFCSKNCPIHIIAGFKFLSSST